MDVRLFSIDVESMYPSIPVEAAVAVARQKLVECKERLREVSHLSAEQISELLALSTRHTYAVVDGADGPRFFRQLKGLAMGKAYAPVLADLYMGVWEERMDETASVAGGDIVFACRYMDDYLIAFRGSEEAFQSFLAALNGRETNIKVTFETEVDGEIPFLDILVKRGTNGFETEVYRKPSNTNYAIPPSSFSDPVHRRAAIVADTTRAIRYCSTPAARQKELAFVHQKYKTYGYTEPFVRRAIGATIAALERKAAVARGEAEAAPAAEQPPPIRLSLPYSGSSFHALRRIGARIGLQLVSKPLATIGSRLCARHKHRLMTQQQSDVVYGIRCSCDQRYVGETGRELGQRVAEHIRGWNHGHKMSPFGGHKNCQPDFEGTEVLASESHPRLRQLMESSYIRTFGARERIIASPNDASINRNAGADLDDRWLPALQAAEQRGARRLELL
jgi:hypothetical protein